MCGPGEAGVQSNGNTSPCSDGFRPGVFHAGELQKLKNKALVCFSNKSTLRRIWTEMNEGERLLHNKEGSGK